jgi:hypothetical protein
MTHAEALERAKEILFVCQKHGERIEAEVARALVESHNEGVEESAKITSGKHWRATAIIRALKVEVPNE